MNELTQDIQLTRICGQRDAALAMMTEAAKLIRRGHELAEQARETARGAANGARFHLVDRSQDSSYSRLFASFDENRSLAVFRQHTDASVWLHVLRATGLEQLMDATARKEFFAQLSSADVPEVNESNVKASLEGLAGDAKLIFQRGLARAFAGLDRRFKSHDAFKIGARIILTNVFDGSGYWNYYAETRATIADVERVLAVLDGQAPEPGKLAAAIEASRAGSYGPRQGVCETRYLRIRTFKNGNAHLWFTRDDLVEKANQVLADYYGAVLPDAVPRDEPTIKTKSGLPAKDLQFYPTPLPVVTQLLSMLYERKGARVLEPSAGTGNIARALVERGYVVDAVEIDPDRVGQLSQIPGVTALPGNFLRMALQPVYDCVVMNPPFYGTHWMEHVVHAFDALAPGGTLLAVLPITAEIGESKKHVAFRKWAMQYSCYGRLKFYSLPAESFAESGTRINTTILSIYQAR